MSMLCRDCHEAVHVDEVNAPDQTTQADFDDYEDGGTTRDLSGSNSPPNINDFDNKPE